MSPKTQTLKHIEHVSLLPDTYHGHIVQIIAQSTLHGPATVYKVPFKEYCNGIQAVLVDIADNDAAAAAERHMMLTGKEDVPF